ncbi:MAG: hypothetical protein P8M22_11665 [Phycisphaerales bacterium]|nr:hypothetical protein [Phycisphaerales bacterium]
MRDYRQDNPSRGFTLAEILVSVGVLIAILIVAGRVFSTAQQVSNVGSASADVLQEAAAIERQIRDDVARMTPQGVVAIRSTSVRNDERLRSWSGAGPRPGLINPNRDSDARIRCDQLVFFTDGVSRVKQYGSDGFVNDGNGWFPKILAEGSMVYYGHGLQFPELKPCNINPDPDIDTPVELLYGHDLDFVQIRRDGDEITPWFDGGVTAAVPTIHREFSRAATDEDYAHFTIDFLQHSTDPIIATQPEARKWILARQEIVMGDDDNQWPASRGKRIYLSRAFGDNSVFPVDPRFSTGSNNIHFETLGLIESSRIDLAGMRISGLREALGVSRSSGNPTFDLPARRSWDQVDYSDTLNRDVLDSDGGIPLPGQGDQQGSQRELVKSLVRWPRAERLPPGEGRFDQHLTIPALGSACSSFIVEWTWDEGVGAVDTQLTQTAFNGAVVETPVAWEGINFNPDSSWNGDASEPAYQGVRWFGLYDEGRQVLPFSDFGDVADTLGWDSFSRSFPPDYGDGTHAPQTVRGGVSGFQASDGSGQATISDPAFGSPAIEEVSYANGFGGQEDQRPIEYWALFGLNNSNPLVDLDERDLTGTIIGGAGDFSQADGLDDFDYSYTPWPSALRFTMVLHDPETRLENGQVVQFVVRLPERCQP